MQPSPEPVAVGVVLAAGMGTRVGADGNKAYLPLAGRSMVSWSVEAVAGSAENRPGDPGVPPRRTRAGRAHAGRRIPRATVELVEGGDTRHGSEENVLRVPGTRHRIAAPSTWC